MTWDSNGHCNVCSNGYFVQDGVTIICPSCKGKLVARNTEAAKNLQFKDPVGKCPRCGGLKVKKGCCGDPDIPCPLCGDNK